MSGESKTKSRLLVVDDSRLMQRTILKMLGAEFDVITADDGIHAWSVLESDRSIQVVFTDVNMPRMDGYELLRMIRTASDPGTQNLPVIVLTGAEDDEAARVEALELGATDFITKPFTSVDVLARARAHANYQRITQQLRSQTTLDSLTGLSNKQGFLDRLQQDISYARRHQQLLTLVGLEIDGFPTIFLRHGKDTAEGLVTLVARLLRASIRKEDTAGRVGLGSFALSLPAGELHGVEGMVDRLRAEVLSQAPQMEVMPVPIELRAAVLSVEVEAGPSAQEALDQCQARLAETRRGDSQAAPSAAAAAPRPSPTPAPAPPRPQPTPAAHAPAPAQAPASLRIDPLLDQIDSGDPRVAIEKMPQILKRLVPLLRLLSPGLRAQLIGFLQKLGA